ncbi:hypothetical protein DSL92_06750 [Billgrantia gudaonensis]|uniref:Uncharacterized protein n=1 Tax=Billgrantia gudaonensis TaxID=376427 RepID=A0A432JII5_9GAMM|nr:hypothetical protein DSL92_06750 [Halomonas gudaonensis]
MPLYAAVRRCPYGEALKQRTLPSITTPAPAETLAAARPERDAPPGRAQRRPGPLMTIEPALEGAARRKAFKGQSFQRQRQRQLAGRTAQWTEGERSARLTPTAWKRLTPSAGDLEGTPPLPEPGEPWPSPEALASLPEPRADLLIHAVQWCRARLEPSRAPPRWANDLLPISTGP